MGKRGNGEGSVYQRKSDGLWVGSISLDNGKRKVFYGKTKKEVTEKLITARHEQLQGVLVTAPAQTLKDYLEHWLEEVQKPTIRTSSYVKYRKVIYTHIIPAIGKVQLQKLTPQRVQSLYTSKLKEGLAPKTVQSIHGVLHKALDNAVKWNLIARNICDAVSPPHVPQTEKQVLTVQQARLLLDYVKKHRLEVLLTVALTTGMRRGEILALRWSDINLEEGSIQESVLSTI